MSHFKQHASNDTDPVAYSVICFTGGRALGCGNYPTSDEAEKIATIAATNPIGYLQQFYPDLPLSTITTPRFETHPYYGSQQKSMF